MVDHAQFVRYVDEVFARLDDRPFLLAHPLPALLVGPDQAPTPDRLRRSLLAAIEQLRPPEGTPTSQTNWRRWRGLSLRYATGLTTKQIAHQLLISERQARRDHESGVAAVAALLWSAYLQRNLADQPRSGPPIPHPNVGAPTDRSDSEELETELTRHVAQAAERSTNLTEAIESALSTIQSLSAGHAARVDVSIPAEVSVVAASPAAVRQVLLCLLTAVAREDPSRRVRLAGVAGPDSIRLTIAVGERQVPWPGPQTADDQALVVTARRLVETEGGSIDWAEGPDHVPRLVLCLPATPVARVLVIDDNPDVAQLFRRFLSGRRYRLVQARTPPTALALAHELRPDAIILDVLMPSQDGWQILQQLRADPVVERVPVIVCSILPERSLALALAAADFLAKPVTPRSLLAALERCLGEPGSATSPDFPEDISSARQSLIRRPGSP